MYTLKEALRTIVYYLYHSKIGQYLRRFLLCAADSKFSRIQSISTLLVNNLRKMSVVLKTIINREAVVYLGCSEGSDQDKYSYESKEVLTFPKISIVTPNFNQGRFLEECIQSVLSQNYSNLEYIIIDGGSTDNSIEIIKKYGNRVKYWVSEKDNGQADAINKGLEYATGEIVNWLNSDDRLMPGALCRCSAAYHENPSAAGWVGGCRKVGEGGSIDEIIFPNGLDRENIGQNWNGKQFYQPSCFLSTKKVREVGGLDPSLYISLDLDLWIRILEHGDFVAGKGIWSEAITHSEAKTQKSIGKMLLETIDLQRKYGFLKGAESRSRSGGKKAFEYTIPDFLLERMAQTNTSPHRDRFHEKRNICFMGDFASQEDIAAVIHFLRNIFPIILKSNWVEFHLIGKNTEKCRRIVSKIHNVKCIADVRDPENPEEVLAKYKLFVCPMTQRGGLKGKIAIAAAAGLPIVTTSMGAEEFPVRDGEECFIADSPVEFGEKCNQCLSDRIAWHNFSIKSQLMLAERLSPRAVADKVRGFSSIKDMVPHAK